MILLLRSIGGVVSGTGIRAARFGGRMGKLGGTVISFGRLRQGASVHPQRRQARGQAELLQIQQALAQLAHDQESLLKVQSEIAALLRNQIDVSEAEQALLSRQHGLLEKILWEAVEGRKTYFNTLSRAAAAPFVNDVVATIAPRQLDMLETLSVVASEGCSFIRFGDGEFKFMLRPEHKQGFQSNSPNLRRALRSILENPNPEGALLGFPLIFHDRNWLGVWADLWIELKPLFEGWTRFGTAHATRPIFFETTGEAGLEAWRRIWAGRSVTIVTGRNSRFNLIPQLFDNIKSADWVYSVPQHAFADVARLLDELSTDKSELILVALGPAGTVLTSALSSRGRWVIDVGHISDSYEHIFEGGTYPEAKAYVDVKQG
jgi:hypothetical protein